MNLIQAALRGEIPYEHQVMVLEQYGKVPHLIPSLRSWGETARNTQQLRHELNKLRYLRHVPEFVPGRLVTPALPPPVEPQKPGGIPEDIQKLYAIRAKAINAREKAGRKLTALADELTQGERADLIKAQKEEHKTVAWSTGILQEWENTGVVNMQPRPDGKKVLSEDEKRWRWLQNEIPKLRRQNKMEDIPALEAEKEQLRVKLGKQKRKSRK